MTATQVTLEVGQYHNFLFYFDQLGPIADLCPGRSPTWPTQADPKPTSGACPDLPLTMARPSSKVNTDWGSPGLTVGPLYHSRLGGTRDRR